MPREIIEVELEVFGIETIPEGSSAELDAEEDPLHIDYEFEKSIEDAKDQEAHKAEADTNKYLEELTGWRIGKSLQVLRKQVNAIAPDRNKASDGTIGDRRHCGRPNPSSDHCPRVRNGRTGVVTAIDITHDPSNGCDAGAMVESIRADRDPRVKYIIWNKQICSSYPQGRKSPWAWRKYVGSNPHTKHAHISVKADSGSYDSQVAWNLSEIEEIA